MVATQKAEVFGLSRKGQWCHYEVITGHQQPCRALWNVAALLSVVLAWSQLASPARAGILYWDTDGATAGNDALTGANLGGAGIWSSADSNWWDAVLGPLQGWSDGSDAAFWG